VDVLANPSGARIREIIMATDLIHPIGIAAPAEKASKAGGPPT
jgi:hypothetical protein